MKQKFDFDIDFIDFESIGTTLEIHKWDSDDEVRIMINNEVTQDIYLNEKQIKKLKDWLNRLLYLKKRKAQLGKKHYA